MRVFLNTSVLLSAIFSAHGHARDLLHLAGQDALTLVFSRGVRVGPEYYIRTYRKAVQAAQVGDTVTVRMTINLP